MPEISYSPNLTVNHSVGPALRVGRENVKDISGVIGGVNTSQLLLTEDANRDWLMIQPLDADIQINFDAAASANNSFLVKKDDTWNSDDYFIPSGNVYLYCGTAGARYVAKYADI